MKLLTYGPDGGDRQTITLRNQVHIGSEVYNGIVLDDPGVSPSHALILITAQGGLIEDLGSETGTWIDDRRVEEPTVLDRPARIGGYIFQLHDCSLDPTPCFFLEEIDTRIRHPLSDGSFVIGDAPGANIHVPGAPPTGLTVQQGRLCTGDQEIALPWQGKLGGIEVRLIPRDVRQQERQPLMLEVRLQPPRARLFEPESGHEHTIRAPNRVALLYYLARAQVEDLEEQVDEERVGWRSDEDVAVAVWGRSGRGGSRNRLNTLTYRLRNELAEHALTAKIIGKMSGWMRLERCFVEFDTEEPALLEDP